MSRIVHARLDEGTARILQRLHQRTGWRDSEIIRQGLRALAELKLPAAARPIAGLGKFRSGIDDLGSNKKHLQGFGR